MVLCGRFRAYYIPQSDPTRGPLFCGLFGALPGRLPALQGRSRPRRAGLLRAARPGPGPRQWNLKGSLERDIQTDLCEYIYLFIRFIMHVHKVCVYIYIYGCIINIKWTQIWL